jgi:hypothetical protein
MHQADSTRLKYPSLRYCSIQTRSEAFVQLKARKITLSYATEQYGLDSMGVQKLYDFTLGTLFFETFIDRYTAIIFYASAMHDILYILVMNSWHFPNTPHQLLMSGREGNRSNGRAETKVQSSHSPKQS